MNPACQQALEGVGSGVAASLRAVDCAANSTAQAAFGRLFGSGGALVPVLTILLTIYVALFAFALITGRSRIGVSALTPRMVMLGMVLTFATSWVAYQGVVWNLAVGAPDQLASLLTGAGGSATDAFAGKIDIVLARLIEAGGNGIAPTSTYSPLGLMWLGGTLLLLGTVGILVTAKIALAVMLAVGPVFVVLALFRGTRGLFVGWLKAMVLLALAPLFAVLSGSLILELAVPVISSLAPVMPGQIDPQAAMAFFLLGAVHVALMIMVLKMAGTMVAGWTVFGLSRSSPEIERSIGMAARPEIAPAIIAATTLPHTATTARYREVRLGSATPAANDAGSASILARSGTTIVAAASVGSAGATNASLSRTQGVGSRFRAPANSRLARSMEKFR